MISFMKTTVPRNSARVLRVVLERKSSSTSVGVSQLIKYAVIHP
jgi:hypothetical protein